MRSRKFKELPFYSEESLQAIQDDLGKVITIPVQVRFEGKNRIFNFTEMEQILRNARRITLSDCGCKTEFQNCDSPRDVCIGLDSVAESALETEGSRTREIGIEEALDALAKSHEAGLVHISYTMKEDDTPGLVCSCCPCCCHTLGALSRTGTHEKLLHSKYVAVNDDEKCVSCGTCVERCVFDTRKMVDITREFDQKRCYGCGLCLSTCPEGAISLEKRKETIV